MALKNGKPNALNALDLRKVSFPAHHFYYTSVIKYSPPYLKLLDFSYSSFISCDKLYELKQI